MQEVFEIVFQIIVTPICIFAFLAYFGIIIDRQVYLCAALYGKINPMHVTYPDGLTVEDTLAILSISRKKLASLVKRGRIRTYKRNDVLHLFTEDVKKYEPEPYNPKYEISDPFNFEDADATA